MAGRFVRSRLSRGAIGGIVFLADYYQNEFDCFSFCQQLDSDYDQEKIQNFKEWLMQQGAKINQLIIHEVKGQGLGVSISDDVAWWKKYLVRKRVIAEIPLDLVICKQTISQDQKVGSIYMEAFEKSGLSEEEVISVWLMVELARGSQSKYSCYINLLPKQLNVPLLWSDEQLLEVQGTTLYHSVQTKRRGLTRRWNEFAQHFSQEILQKHGVSVECCFEDFMWGYCIYMSRAVGLPPIMSPDGEQIRSRDGLVPGMDFCNHSPQPTAYWTVLGAAGKIGGVPSVKIIQSGGTLQRGMEVTFDYGSRSDEQFLFVYGFLNAEDPYKQLYDEAMVKLPLPSMRDMTQVLYDRMLLLQKMEKRPQFFLKPITNHPSKIIPETYQVEDDIIQILDVLVIEHEEVLQRLQDETYSQVKYPTYKQFRNDNNPRLMGILTTYIQLLKETLEDLESLSQGTGPLQKDQMILKAGDGTIPYWKICAIKYRMGQKSIIRQHLNAGQKILDQLMMEMQQEQKNKY